jgi:hypothetical protein
VRPSLSLVEMNVSKANSHAHGRYRVRAAGAKSWTELKIQSRQVSTNTRRITNA